MLFLKKKRLIFDNRFYNKIISISCLNISLFLKICLNSKQILERFQLDSKQVLDLKTQLSQKKCFKSNFY